MTDQAAFDELADSSPFVFIGEIARAGQSTVPTVPADETTVVVAVEEAIRTPPGFGSMVDQEITVRLLTPIAAGRYVFFADPVAIGPGIAVQERAHLDAGEQSARDQVDEVLARGYAARIAPRITTATVVALGTVGEVRALESDAQQDDDSVAWAAAPFQVEELVKGQGVRSVPLVGPRTPTRRLPRTPTLRPDRYAVLILRPPPPEALEAVAKRDRPRTLFVEDTDDIQPPERLEDIRRIARESEKGGA